MDIFWGKIIKIYPHLEIYRNMYTEPTNIAYE